MSDFAEAITIGMKEIFSEEASLLKCYFHLVKNIKTKLRFSDDNLKTEIKGHIKFLSWAASKEDFHYRWRLVKAEWLGKKSDKINKFLTYFEKTYMKKSRENWYLGAALERFNRLIKDDYFPEKKQIGILFYSSISVISYSLNP